MSGGVALLRVPPLLTSFRLGALALVVLCGLGFFPAPVAADSVDDARARAHFAAGQEYFAQERFSEAASEFDEAYRLSGRPEMLINRARAEERAGALEQAVTALELLFERYPQTSYRAEAEQQLARLKVELDSRAALALPAPAAVAAAPAPGPSVRDSAPAERPVKVWPPRLPTLIVGGALVASVLVSVGTGWAAHAKYKQVEEHCPDDQCPDDAQESNRQRGQTLSRVSTGFTFASVALAAATSVLWFYDVKAQKARVSLGVRPALASAHAQLRWVY
jgi:tetratricopeptide (TPR) repeat protein